MRCLNLLLPLFVGILLACGETVDLLDELGYPVLSYSCSKINPHAESDAERTVVRTYVAGMIRYSAEAKIEIPIDRLLSADTNGDFEALEEMVVEYLCAGGTVASRAAMASEPIMFKKERVTPHKELLTLGSRAPDFVLPLLAIESHAQGRDLLRLSSLRGERVLLHFWGSWCGPCKREVPKLEEMRPDLRDIGVRFLSVACLESPGKTREWLVKEGLTGLPTVVDEEGDVQEAYHIHVYSTTYQIGPTGIIERVWIGWDPPYPELVLKELASLPRRRPSLDRPLHF